jgi:arginine deiminase
MIVKNKNKDMKKVSYPLVFLLDPLTNQQLDHDFVPVIE